MARPRLSKFWEDIRHSLWFLPTLVIVGFVLVAGLLVEVDQRIDSRIYEAWPNLFRAGAEGSRVMLGAIATSIVTVAGVTFSITTVALSLASSQYTSRVLRTFQSDRGNQATLGAFLGIFAYCLVVLRTLSGSERVPILATSGAVVLAFVGIGFLVYFIHHVATAIQASYILAAIGEETSGVVDLCYPEELGTDDEAPDERHARPLEGRTWYPIPARRTGYVQRVDQEALLRLARERHAVVRMDRGIGDFAIEGAPLVSISCDEEPGDDLGERLEDVYVIGRHRTSEQDVSFGIRQLVDVAMKALSPGVNDTTTSIMCVDQLSALLVRLAGRRMESPYRLDGGELRVVGRGPTFEDFLVQSCAQIYRHAGGNAAVLTRLLHAIETISGVTTSKPRREAMLGQVEAILEVVGRTIPAPRERAHLEQIGNDLLGRLRRPDGDRVMTEGGAGMRA